MTATTYILDSSNFIVGTGSDAALPEGFSTVESKKDLGDLSIPLGLVSIPRYKWVNGRAIEQKIQPVAEINSNNDVVALHLRGHLENPDPQLVPISDKQYRDLTREGDDPEQDGLRDPETGAPRYHISKNKVSKKRQRLDTVGKCDQALSMVNSEMDARIAARYSAGKESKLAKGFLEWMAAGKPKKDEREAAFTEMQAFIQGVRDEFAPRKSKIKKQREKLLKG